MSRSPAWRIPALPGVVLGLFAASATIGPVEGAFAQTLTPIAAIQAAPATFVDSVVTVRGQVFIRTNYSPFKTAGYLVDSSGRGIFLFGSGANHSGLTDTGNIVTLSGEVQLSGGITPGLTNVTGVTVESSGNPPARPIHLSTAAAAADTWEGAFLEVNGTIQSSTFVNGGRNYSVDDGTGVVVVRVESVVMSSQIADGTQITARGAGTTADGADLLVGAASDVFADTPPADTAPPVLLGAWTPEARTEVRLTFDEAVDPATAGDPVNYQLFETAQPANVAGVTGATVSGPEVVLAVSTPLPRGQNWTVRVENVADTSANTMLTPGTLTFDTPVGDIDPPQLVSATNTGTRSVEVRFNEAVDAVTGGDPANYSVFETAAPANTVPVTGATPSGAMVTLALGADLAAGTGYTVQVQNVQDTSGNAIVGAPTATFTTSPPVTPIADIQNNVAAFEGQVVTVEGQVFVPANYRGTVTSGYIQDGSGRGINLFGDGANTPVLNDVTNVVRVTGTVQLFFTTVEITNITDVTLVSTGNPELQPAVLSTGAAANAQWEGTYIQTTGPIVAKATGGPGINYTVDDGSGPVVIRVVDALGATEFNVGQTITGRGAGGQFQSDFQINVGRAQDVFVESGGPDTTPPTITSASAPSATQVLVAFSETVTAATAEVAANYAVFETAAPANTVPVSGATLSADRRTVTLTLGASLTDGTNYTVRVNAVEDDAGNAIAPNSTASFLFSTAGVTPIATIQADPNAFDGQVVTVQGQVYIPANYRGTVTSGYIQDDSGRGINIFGSGADDPIMNDLSNVVRVTGTVTLFFTTVEVTNVTEVTLVSTGNPPLRPTPLSTGAAASSDWEGTFIQVTGEILAKAVGGPGLNYTVNDGSGPIVVRVVDALGAPEFNVGQTITARGAGGQFQSDFQVNVGTPDGIFLGAPSEDILPPSVLKAALTAPTQVSVTFSEAVDAVTATDPANYEVFRTAAPATQVTVTAAQLGSANDIVVLTLASAIQVGEGWSVRVRNVQDLAGNAISAAGVTRAVEEPTVEAITLSGPPFTFLPRNGETYPVTFSVPSRLAGGGAEVLLRVFDLQGRLRRTLFDSRFADLGSVLDNSNRATQQWDGRDNVSERVAAGTYVVHLLVVDPRTGDREERQIPVVVATRLER